MLPATASATKPQVIKSLSWLESCTLGWMEKDWLEKFGAELLHSVHEMQVCLCIDTTKYAYVPFH